MVIGGYLASLLKWSTQVNTTIRVHALLGLVVFSVLFVVYGIFFESEPSHVGAQMLSTAELSNDKVLVRYQRTVNVYTTNAASIGHVVKCNDHASVDLGARLLNWIPGTYVLDTTFTLPNSLRGHDCTLTAVLAWNAKYSLIQHVTPRPPMHFTITQTSEITNFKVGD